MPEIRKVEIVKDVESNKLSQVEAAQKNNVTDRTIRNWIVSYEKYGAEGFIHGNRGKQSPRKISKREEKKILSIIHKEYADFGPTFAAEKLEEIHGIKRDPKTIRALMVEEGLWTPRKNRTGVFQIHRQWRERRAHRGEMVQFDGSYHDWFEGRLKDNKRASLKHICLLAAIDDATSDVTHLRFDEDEGTLPVMDFWTQYGRIHGLPKSVYLDRFSTYKLTQQVAKENPDLKTQLERAFKMLGVEPIFALSPQAKGRVERLFKTLQNRLVKEMRIHNICTVEEANEFMLKIFLPRFNKRYSVVPREQADFHRILSKREAGELSETFCRMEKRVVMNDFTVSYKTSWYQLLPTQGLAIRPKDPVIVREYPDGTVSFSVRNKRTNVQIIQKQQERKPTTRSKRKIHRTLTPIFLNRKFSFPAKPEKIISR
jgi:transposase